MRSHQVRAVVPWLVAAATLLAIGVGTVPLTAAQPAAAAPRPKPVVAVSTDGGFVVVRLLAERVRVADIASELGRLLRVRVVVGPAVADELATVDLVNTPLEAALPALAPGAFLDYEVRQGSPPAPRVIYLLGPGDPAPPSNRTERGTSDGLLITGHTEEPVDGPADALTVAGDAHSLTITAKQQPLSLVAIAVGEALGVPVDVTFEPPGLVDVSLQNQAAEYVVTSISPYLSLHVRLDLLRMERTPLKLVVAGPAGK